MRGELGGAEGGGRGPTKSHLPAWSHSPNWGACSDDSVVTVAAKRYGSCGAAGAGRRPTCRSPHAARIGLPGCAMYGLSNEGFSFTGIPNIIVNWSRGRISCCCCLFLLLLPPSGCCCCRLSLRSRRALSVPSCRCSIEGALSGENTSDKCFRPRLVIIIRIRCGRLRNSVLSAYCRA